MAELENVSIYMDRLSEYVRINRSFTDGSQDLKHILLPELIKMLNGTMQGTGNVLIGEIPYGYYKGAINPCDISTFQVAIIMPAEKRVLNYFEDEHIVPFPELLFLFRAEGGRIISSKLYSIIQSRGQKMIAAYPFGNVFDNGNICWGTNRLPEVSNMKEVEQILSLFFAAVTNDHLYSAGSNVIKKEEFYNQRGLILALKKKQKFPVGWLKSYHESVEETVNMFINLRKEA